MWQDFGIVDNSRSAHCARRSLGLRSVKWADGFWGERFQQCRQVTLPHLWKRLDDPELGHVTSNFRIYAGLEEGEILGSYWQDEWLYKWLEAAAYIYAYAGEESLDRRMDEAIALIAKAQEPDGYLCCGRLRFQQRFVVPRRHELYNMGHLITAACAHHRATGKANFLDIARKAADCLYNTFAPNAARFANFSIAKSYIMAVVELYRLTRDERYLELANVFVDLHGAKPPKDRKLDLAGLGEEARWLAELDGTDMRQTRVPLRQETRVVGHAVNFTYLYASAADIFMETGDDSLLQALNRLWNDLVSTKIYVNGGVCAHQHALSVRGDRVGEAAGEDYELPNASAYNETCGQVGNFMWNWRMLLITGQARFADLMELNLYNSILSSSGLDGASWFYMNPLRWHGKDQPRRDPKHRSVRYQPGEPPGRSHTCCPTNLLRTMASLHGYLYSLDGEGLFVDHYAASRFDGALLDGSPLRFSLATAYPWDGHVAIAIELAPEREFPIRLRIPDWAAGAQLKLNGRWTEEPIRAGSYCAISRPWKTGDVIELELPMEVRLLGAHPKVESCRNHAAVKRGPILYCLESPDLPAGVRVSQIRLPRNAALAARHEPSLLGGVTILEGPAFAAEPEDWAGPLYRPLSSIPLTQLRLRLIPYYAWANRGESEMTVWMPLAG